MQDSGEEYLGNLDGWRVTVLPHEETAAIFWNKERIASIPMTGAQEYGCDKTSHSPQNLSWSRDGGLLICERGIGLDLNGPVIIHVRDVIRIAAQGLIEWHRAWWHEEKRVVSRLQLCAVVRVEGQLLSHLLPGILYDGNKGAVAERLVPRLSSDIPNLFEEHKYPTPMVHVETAGRAGGRFGITMKSVPCTVTDGHLHDQWWSLGLAVSSREGEPQLMSVSGRLSMNGQDETVYTGQNRTSPYRDAWVDARPHHIYEKHYRIHLQQGVPQRRSWRVPLLRVMQEQPALSRELAWTQKAALEDAIGLKVSYALSRWAGDENCSGMSWWPNRPEFAEQRKNDAVEFGWVGMNMRLAVSLWR